jgi:glycosyltransferase involved in cell wall biosynthesis
MTNNTKILHIMPRYSTGGAERLVLEYAKNVKKLGITEMHVVSSVEDGELKSEFKKTKAKVFVGSRVKHGGRYGAWKAVKEYVVGLKPEVIHTHLLGGDLFGYALKKRANWPVRWVVTLHNVEHQTSALRRFVWKYILRHADLVIAVSPAVLEFAKKEFGIPENKIKLLQNAVDLDRWLGVKNDSMFTNKILKLATIGRLEYQKGYDILLNSIVSLKDVDWQLNVFGEGSLENKLKKQAKNLGIEKNIIWHGVVSDLPKRLVDIDVVVTPSRWEGMSLAVMEAMVAGKLVVCSKSAGEGLVEHGKTGVIMQSAEFRMQNELFNDLPQLRKMADNARTYAKENFGIEKHLQELKKIYQSL